MTKILHLDSSPRAERSHSRTLAGQFISSWQNTHTDDVVLYRDLGHQTLPYVTENWIAASFTPPEKQTPVMKKELKVSDVLIEELRACDRYVFSMPMYNLSVPAIFKSYIDQIIRVNHTFKFDEQGKVIGLMKDKKMLIITARGDSFQPGTPSGAYDFQEPYLKALFGYVGITDISFVHAENLNTSAEARANSLVEAEAALEQMVAS